ncbi:MAG: hypothetical protein ACT4PX_07855 [Actinomycetota bacterium]
MHPMERLRSVARASDAGPGTLAREAAAALAGLGPDHAALVTSCRRLVERHPACGPMWWLASSVLCAADPVAEARRAAADLAGDATVAALAAALPDDATVVLLGWPEQALDAVVRRGDLDVRLVSAGGGSSGLAGHLRAAGTAVEDVPDAGLAAAVAGAGALVLLEASALGPERFAAVPGSHAAAAVARAGGVPVWLVAGVGRVLPGPLWDALEHGLARSGAPPWLRSDELAPLALCDVVVGPGGPAPAAEAAEATCPVAPELLRRPV